MKCSVFIATSADGYIATPDGGVEWLETAGRKDIDLGDQSDMGFNKYIASVDCMIMGRNSVEKLSSFNLTDEQWPYGSIQIFGLSNTIVKAPENLGSRVQMYSGDIAALVSNLESRGLQHAYIDGGVTITSFLNEKLINEMTITKAPVLLGSGKPLFGKTSKHIKLENAEVIAYPNDFIQIRYDVTYR
jgi:dihydrofolate reductase